VKKAVISIGVVIIVLLLVARPAHTELPPNPDTLISWGKKVYIEQCAECHQTDGQGWPPLYPRLAGNPIVTLHDPSPIIATVLNGQGSMRPFRDVLSSEDIASALSYIRNTWGNEASAVSPRQIR
jgi:mono/diheme cytochrome c family protein